MQVATALSFSLRTRKLTGVCLSSLFLLSAILCAQPETSAQTAGASASQTSRRKVITNQDLEAVRRKRLAGEADYERKRAAEGLPSQEELQRQAEERDRRFIELAARLEAARVAEEYEQLSRELSLLRSQLNLLGTQASGASTADAPYPLYYSFPLVVPGRHRSPFSRPGIGSHSLHGRAAIPWLPNRSRSVLRGGFHGRRTGGGASINLRFGSTPRTWHAPRSGHGRGSGGRR